MESAKRERKKTVLVLDYWNRMYKAARKRCRDEEDFVSFQLSYEYVIKPSEC